jgi:hypothetical protein
MNSHKNMKKQMRTMFLGGYEKSFETAMVYKIFIIKTLETIMVLIV